MKKKQDVTAKRTARQQRKDRLVGKLLEVDELKQASGWGPACRACTYARRCGF